MRKQSGTHYFAKICKTAGNAQQVYALFDLTPTEVDTLEASVRYTYCCLNKDAVLRLELKSE